MKERGVPYRKSHDASQRVDDLERLLLARRRLTRLIMREKSPSRLLERTCAALCEAMDWPGAWGVHVDESGHITHRCWAGSGVGDAQIQAHRKGEEPLPCLQQALGTTGIHYRQGREPGCTRCPVAGLSDNHGVVRVRLEHDGQVLGALVLRTPRPIAPDPVLRAFIEDLCADLALALHGIRIERERRESEARFRTVTDIAQDAMIMMGPDGCVTLWNPAAELMFGYSEAEARGQHIHRLLAPVRYHEAYYAAFPGFQRSGRGAAVGRTLQLDALRKNGQEFPVELSLSAFESARGWQAVAIVRDITERRQLHDQLAQRDRLASVGMLAAGVAHEINNPLSFILYNLESLSEELGFPPSPAHLGELRELVEDAHEGAERIRAIARDLKTFSRVEQGARELLDLAQPLDAAANMAHNEVKHRARLHRRYQPIGPVLGNEGALAQVFLNLLVNAAQAIPEGNASAHTITLCVHQHDGEVLATIEDTGSGITPERMGTIFDPFHTTKESGQGSGLGLAICQRIVREHGGRITVCSTPGQGSSFTVHLPLQAEDLDPELSTQEIETSLAQIDAGRVLVVDDEPLIRRSIQRILAREHTVVTCDSGLAASRVLANDPNFDAVLCDLMMPKMTGMDLHAWMQQHTPWLAPRVIFMTGGAFTPRAQAFLDSFPGRKLSKPISAGRLRGMIGELMSL